MSLFNRKLSIASKINIMFLSILLPVIIGFIFLLRGIFTAGLINERKTLIKSHITSAKNVYDCIGKTLTDVGREKINKVFFNYVNKYNYSKNGYFYVYKMDGTLLAHNVLKNKIGQSLWNLKGKKGNYIIREHAKVVEKYPKGGFISYWWPKYKNSPTLYEKLSFTVKLNENMFIGTGLYFDDIQKEALIGTIQLTGILFVAMLLVNILISFLLRRMLRPLTEIKTVFKEIAEGDLTKDIKIGSKDEIGELSVSFMEFLGNIRTIVGNIKKSSDEVTGTTDVLSSTISESTSKIDELVGVVNEINENMQNQDKAVQETTAAVTEMINSVDSISTNIENQAAAVEQSSSSIEEMASSVNAVAETAKQANNIAISLSKVATEGGDAIQKSIDAIHEIEDSSQQISEIVDLITGIAEQTNLLAMNAAIEAAHAGEYGKGFAVVADEIRKLAENSASSGKEITNLVVEITEKIERTAELTTSAISGLNRILEDVDQTNKINTEISTAMNQQSVSVKEILNSMTSLVSITEEVKIAIREQKVANNEISDVVVNLKNISNLIHEAVQQGHSHSSNIMQAIDNIREENNKNKNVVNKLDSVLSMFKVKEEKNSLTIAEDEN